MARVDFFSEISNKKMDWNLKVRVVRMWHATPRDKSNFLLSIELILQDAKGEKIHATIPRSVVHHFRGEKNAIKEMRLYLVNTFVVEPNNMHYKTTAHNFKLEFTSKTIAIETIDSDFGLNIFNFRLFKDLKNHIDIDETQLFDVIG
ncbi:replication protein A 70 kDa DNA-binding subunit B-like [Capsicum chacoense]